MSDEASFVVFGKLRYEAFRPFARFPAGMTLGRLSGGAVDSKGSLHICQRADPPILVFDKQGTFVRSYGEEVIVESHGICITADDRALVVDRGGHQVVAFDMTGRVLFTLGQRNKPQQAAPFSRPTHIALGPNGDMYVSDGDGNKHIHQFSADGQLKRTWGGPGTAPGLFATPHGVEVLKDGRVLAADRENNRIQIFDPDGKYLTEWKDFYHPMDIYADGNGMVYIGDQEPTVHARREDGTIVGRSEPALSMPHGIAGDRDGTLYVIDPDNPAVTRLVPVA